MAWESRTASEKSINYFEISNSDHKWNIFLSLAIQTECFFL